MTTGAMAARVVIGVVAVVGYALLAHTLSTQSAVAPLAWVYFAQDGALNVGLALLFGASLRRGEMPLCSRVALLLQPQPSALSLRYTRAVTWAWTAFFGAIVAISTTLFFCTAHSIWSTFANLLYWPLLIAMFASEYVVRVLVLPRAERTGFFATIGAFRRVHDRCNKNTSIAS